jgi:O-antigen ligase
VGEALLWQGGFAPAPRIVFGALALAALAASAVNDREAVWRMTRRPAILALVALAALAALSALWTAGGAGDALRWALVAAGYGAIAVTAGVLTRRPDGVRRLAALVCVLAIIGGAIGLVAACVIGEPLADRIAGSWRPGGPLEYSSALALLEVSALPALLVAMCSPRRGLAAAGVIGATIAGAVLGLADSRAELLLAALIGCAAIALPRRTLRASRTQAAAATLWVAASGLGAHLIAGGWFPPGTLPGPWRLLGLGGACALLSTIWLARGLNGGRRAQVAIACGLSIGLVVALGAGAAASGASTAPRPALHPTTGSGLDSDVFHGRLHLWQAGVETFAAHPLLGAGADSFMVASARYQQSGPIRFAHNLPLELGAELGIGGFLLCLWLYAASGAAAWRARRRSAGWLLGPGMCAFLAASLVDWPWHLAGSGAVWAVCTGGVIGAVTFRAWPRASRPSTTTAVRMRSRSRTRSRSGLTASRSR